MMNKLNTIFRTLISKLLLLCLMVLYALPFIIALILPTRWLYKTPFFYWLTYSFSWLLVKCSFLDIRWEGLENLPGTPVIIVANHQSSLDIPIIGVLLKGDPQIWLATTYLKKFWLYRVMLPKFVVWVDMSNSLKGMRSLVQVIKILKDTNQHVIIFPEGARFTDGTIHNFYAGFAVLAKKTGRPVLPIKLEGLNKIYPPNTFWVEHHPVTVRVGTPEYIHEDESEQEFRTRVRTWFLDT
jgi:1-acyl-sn-glycerol-3-phosphate acyltransferase